MSNSNNISEIVIGQRVFSSLYGGRNGIVFAMEVSAFNQSVFDVVYDNGLISKRLSAFVLKGVQWRIIPEIASADEIAGALALAAITKANANARASEAKQRDDATLTALRTSAQWAHLLQGDDEYSGKLAARNIRAELKKNFPREKFSVRVTHYGTIRIQWTDGPMTDSVTTISCKYKVGSFDGMDDSYKFDQGPWHKMFGGAKYIFESRQRMVKRV